MMLETADLKQIIDYLLVNPKPTEEETGAMLLNICRRLESLNVQNKKTGFRYRWDPPQSRTTLATEKESPVLRGPAPRTGP